jgi:hypothetical protein
MITSCTGPGSELETTLIRPLIRGLATAFRAFVSGLSSVYRTGVGQQFVGQLPGHFGISAGATTMQACPRTSIWRYSPYPVGRLVAEMQLAVTAGQFPDRPLHRSALRA